MVISLKNIVAYSLNIFQEFIVNKKSKNGIKDNGNTLWVKLNNRSNNLHFHLLTVVFEGGYTQIDKMKGETSCTKKQR